jgi:hypothetical protein
MWDTLGTDDIKVNKCYVLAWFDDVKLSFHNLTGYWEPLPLHSVWMKKLQRYHNKEPSRYILQSYIETLKTFLAPQRQLMYLQSVSIQDSNSRPEATKFLRGVSRTLRHSPMNVFKDGNKLFHSWKSQCRRPPHKCIHFCSDSSWNFFWISGFPTR